jgi:thiol-disulfide isomerase/thioredoxin
MSPKLAAALLLTLLSPAFASLANAEEPVAPTIQVVDKAGYDAVLAKHRGRVVVVDFWALWCTECLKEFKYTVEFAGKYEKQGLSVVAMSFDDEGTDATAGKFLAKQNAKFPTLRSKFGSDEESFETWAIPSGTLPHVKIYGRDGTLLKTFDAGDDPDAPSFGHEDVEAAIKAILAKSPPTSPK